MYAHLQEDPPRLRVLAPQLPRALDLVVARAMAKDPADRFPSAGDLARAAEAAIAGEVTVESERSVAIGAAAPGPPEATTTAEREVPEEQATEAQRRRAERSAATRAQTRRPVRRGDHDRPPAGGRRAAGRRFSGRVEAAPGSPAGVDRGARDGGDRRHRRRHRRRGQGRSAGHDDDERPGRRAGAGWRQERGDAGEGGRRGRSDRRRRASGRGLPRRRCLDRESRRRLDLADRHRHAHRRRADRRRLCGRGDRRRREAKRGLGRRLHRQHRDSDQQRATVRANTVHGRLEAGRDRARDGRGLGRELRRRVGLAGQSQQRSGRDNRHRPGGHLRGCLRRRRRLGDEPALGHGLADRRRGPTGDRRRPAGRGESEGNHRVQRHRLDCEHR